MLLTRLSVFLYCRIQLPQQSYFPCFLLHKTSVEYTRLYSSIAKVLICTVAPRILAPLPTMFSLPKFHSQMSFFFTAHETRSMLKRISSAPKISTTTSPSPALSYQAQACSKPPIQIFMLFKIGSNRAVKKPSTILAFWRLLTLSA